MKDNLTISLLIPTYKPSAIWSKVLEAASDQSLNADRKIIVDSGSPAEALAIASSHGFEIHHIDKSDFGHGKTRQQLVDLADTDICVFLTQDAILASVDSLQCLVEVFSDLRVGVAYGRQLPHKGATALEAHARLYNYPPQSMLYDLADVSQFGFKTFFCSNSFAAYRKSTLLSIGGFSTDSIMGEDAIATAKMLMCGYKKAYVAEAAVYHSHNYTLTDEFRRYFDTRVFHEQNRWLIERFGKPTGEGFKFIRSELSYSARDSLRSVAKCLASAAAKWTGYKIGRYYKKMPRFFLQKFSMHNYYWENQSE
jgi:rhamnosyltransferase